MTGAAPSDPGFALRFSRRSGWLQVEVSGDIDAQSVRIGYWRAIAEEARARGVRKVLVFDRKKGHPASPDELAELAVMFRDERSHFDRVAVVEPTLGFLPSIEHAEIYGREQGINVRVFADPDEAERWLWYGAGDD
jgi:hypothetical protein